MNLEQNKTLKAALPITEVDQDLDFDFRPITSGLGFHHQKTTAEIKPSFIERRNVAPQPVTKTAPTPSIYQNDLSMFYGQQSAITLEQPDEKTPARAQKKTVKASKAIRSLAYGIDLSVVAATVTIMLTAMTKTSGMRLMDTWREYPHEVTPLVVTLSVGIYLLYFSLFEKMSSSTLGKNLLSMKVTSSRDGSLLSFNTLILRTTISLLNFVSLGLFCWFSLQDKVTHSQVVKAK